MTFLEIVNAVLNGLGDETRRGDAQRWVNHRYTWLTDLEQWTFMQATSAVTVTANSQIVTGVPADFAIAKGLLRSDGWPLEPVRDTDEFYDRYYNPNSPTTGRPEAFTVVGGSILVGPISNETSSAYWLIYERAAQPMVLDTDVPIIPAGYHMGLVHGGKAEGFRLTNIPLADQFDADFRGTVDAMRSKYLVAVRDTRRQSPAYRPY